MVVIVVLRFACPSCELPQRVELTAALPWKCEHCSHQMPLAAPQQPFIGCLACGNKEFYRQKNFPQWLGLSILAFACSAFFILS